MTQPLRDDRPLRPCPECVERYGGNARIGNRKGSCATCNRFGQAVRRAVARDLAALHEADAERYREAAEARLYDDLLISEATRPEGARVEIAVGSTGPRA